MYQSKSTRARFRAPQSFVFVLGLGCVTAIGCQVSGAMPPSQDDPGTVDPQPEPQPDPGSQETPPPDPEPASEQSAACASPSGDLFEVGPDKAYAGLVDVPWSELSAGDTVRIHYRKAPYKAKVLINARGTEAEPITLCGVPGPGGELPTVTGADAVTPEGVDFGDPHLQDLGTIVIYDPGYESSPAHIVIEGLHVTGASQENSYTGVGGDSREYSRGAACIRVQEGDHITIRKNMITGCGNGIMAISRSENKHRLTTDLVIQDNYLQDNGAKGSDRQHSIYVQALGILIEGNYFGPLRPDSKGGNIKDRSAGTIIRYNWIEDGARLIDLVEGGGFRAEHESYRKSYVYGNVITARGDTGGALLVHYGYDSSPGNTRAGTLYFYNNTVVVRSNIEDHSRIRLFDLSTSKETVEAWNNIVYVGPRTEGAEPSPLYITRYDGTAKMGVNWVSANYEDGDGEVVGKNALILGDKPPVDFEKFLPLPGSEVVDAGEPGPGGVPEALRATRQYVPHGGSRERSVSGGGLDLGAFEAQAQ